MNYIEDKKEKGINPIPVSYTHLDVYKRQIMYWKLKYIAASQFTCNLLFRKRTKFALLVATRRNEHLSYCIGVVVYWRLRLSSASPRCQIIVSIMIPAVLLFCAVFFIVVISTIR